MPNQPPPHLYGGQAVIEGVMIRGQRHFSLAVRRPDGTIENRHEPLNPLYNGPLRRLPLARGVLTLIETLILGIKSLQISADLAAADPRQSRPDGQNIPGWMLAGTLAFSLIFGIGLFFLLPIGIVRLLEPVIGAGLISETIEGLLRLAILIGYITAIGLMPDIRRVYAYHGAEHMTVHAHEAGLPLNIPNVRRFPTPHPRCGTAFLLTVIIVSVAVFIAFSLLELSWWWRIASRILLLPAIAALSYEIIRFSGRRSTAIIGKTVAAPGLWLQRLTTRPPDDAQIEVAIEAMQTALTADAQTAPAATAAN